MSLPKNALKAINQVNINYIWKRKTHYIRKGIMVKEYEEGGLKPLICSVLMVLLKQIG